MSPSESLLRYLRAYEAKDILAIAQMLADVVTLQDWNLAVEGRGAVLEETEKNFAAVDTISIEVRRQFESGTYAAAELRITIDGTIVLDVVDSLRFSPDGKIEAIRAYKG